MNCTFFPNQWRCSNMLESIFPYLIFRERNRKMNKEKKKPNRQKKKKNTDNCFIKSCLCWRSVSSVIFVFKNGRTTACHSLSLVTNFSPFGTLFDFFSFKWIQETFPFRDTYNSEILLYPFCLASSSVNKTDNGAKIVFFQKYINWNKKTNFHVIVFTLTWCI